MIRVTSLCGTCPKDPGHIDRQGSDSITGCFELAQGRYCVHGRHYRRCEKAGHDLLVSLG